MVGAPNARTKVDNQQTAELNGNPGVDTHFAQLFGFSGDDTRAVTLAGEVTDTHAAQLNGEGTISLTGGTSLFAHNSLSTPRSFGDSTGLSIVRVGSFWRDVRSYNVSSPGAGKSLYIIFMFHIDIVTINPETRSYSWRILKNNSSTIANGSISLNSEFPRAGVFSFIDSDPGEDSNTYKFQIRRGSQGGLLRDVLFAEGSLNSSVITLTEDTHQAVFSGVTGTDTHRAVLEGPNGSSIEPKLLGDSGVDTHAATLIGDRNSATFASPSITPLSGSQIRLLARNATTSQSVPFLTRSVVANEFTENILIGFQISMRSFTNTIVSWLFRKSNGVVFSQGQRGPVSGTPLHYESGVFIDNDPLIGTNTYELFSWGNSLNVVCASATAVSYLITDDHSADLIGTKTDTHAYQLSGSVTPDTHSVVLNGSPPVDTHSVNLIGNVRGKSPIGGRLR